MENWGYLETYLNCMNTERLTRYIVSTKTLRYMDSEQLGLCFNYLMIKNIEKTRTSQAYKRRYFCSVSPVGIANKT